MVDDTSISQLYMMLYTRVVLKGLPFWNGIVIIMDAYNYVLLVCMSDMGIVLHIASNYLKGILTYDSVWLT